MRWCDYKNMKEAFDAADILNKEVTVVRYMKGKSIVSVKGHEFFHDIRKYASAFTRMGFTGQHVAIIGKNTYEYLISLCALLYMGSPSILLSKDYTVEEIKDYCELTETKTILYSYELEEHCLALQEEYQLVAMHETEIPSIPSMQVEKENELVDIQNTTGLDDLINVLFTSGTTGKSKAVMHSNRSLMAGVIDPYMDEHFDSVLVVFPFHHVAGYCLALECIFAAETICLGEDPSRIIRYLDNLKPEFIFVVPALMQVLCMKLKNKTQEQLGWNIRCIGCGGAKSIASAFELIFSHGIKIFQSYASSECAGRGIFSFITEDKIDTLGKPGYGVLTKIVDGELLMGGAQICMGYYNNPKETEETFKDGWYYTGDLVELDEDGDYFLTGRKKNLIILSNGENVSPEEIEQVLSNYKEILEVLVREEGDVIGAVIYPDYADCTTEEEKEAMKERIATIVEEYNDEALTYKQIHHVTVTDQPLPKTSTNKILRH